MWFATFLYRIYSYTSSPFQQNFYSLQQIWMNIFIESFVIYAIVIVLPWWTFNLCIVQRIWKKLDHDRSFDTPIDLIKDKKNCLCRVERHNWIELWSVLSMFYVIICYRYILHFLCKIDCIIRLIYTQKYVFLMLYICLSRK